MRIILTSYDCVLIEQALVELARSDRWKDSEASKNADRLRGSISDAKKIVLDYGPASK